MQEIFPRYDIKRPREIAEINNGIRDICRRKGAEAIPDPPLTERDYSSGGLHLNYRGKCKLGKRINNHIMQSYKNSPAQMDDSEMTIDSRPTDNFLEP